jgi:preprotein translocase subunit SecG
VTAVLLIIHLFVTLALIGVVLIQRSEGGGLGIGTSQGMGSFMSGRGTANLLTRMTAILATLFMLLSLALALLNRGTTGVSRSILDLPATSSSVPSPGSAPPADAAPPASGSTAGTPRAAPATPALATPAPATPAQATPAQAAPATGPSVPTN